MTLAKLDNQSFEATAGLDLRWYSLPPQALARTAVAPYPIDDLTGYTAAGAILEQCGGKVLLPLQGTQAAPVPADQVRFFVADWTGVIQFDDGEEITRTIVNAQGVRLVLPTVPVGAHWYYLNLVAPDGSVIPFVKGSIDAVDCGVCC